MSVACMRTAEHLGSCRHYTLRSYLSIGECDGAISTDDMYAEAMKAIFEEHKPCHRWGGPCGYRAMRGLISRLPLSHCG